MAAIENKNMAKTMALTPSKFRTFYFNRGRPVGRPMQ